MTAKEFLQRYGDAIHDERRILAEIEELRERATSIRGGWHGESYMQEIKKGKDKGKKVLSMAVMPNGRGGNDSMAEVDAYIDKEFSRLRKAKANSFVARREVVAAIDLVEDARYRELLSHRYIGFHTWEWIAETMETDTKQVWRWHGRALREILF
jgi:hypothetical protein